MKTNTFDADIARGDRFEFGKNWRRFLKTVDDQRIEVAQRSIIEMLGTASLDGKQFLDVGSGSGLFSLAARKLGATVRSFDFDPASVACTRGLRRRFFADDPRWTIEEGSVLDEKYLRTLGTFDIVYSWGVLHHTGDMWRALKNAGALVGTNGVLFIAIYNDQGGKTAFWKKVKRWYCSGNWGRAAVCAVFIPYFFTRTVLSSVRQGRNIFADYRKNRGMSIIHDWIDWLGGFPFEAATADAIVRFYRDQGFAIRKIRATDDSGNNQFVFTKIQ